MRAPGDSYKKIMVINYLHKIIFVNRDGDVKNGWNG